MNSEKTAMYIELPSNATRKLVEFMDYKTPFPTVLDYGAGNGRNAYFISNQSPAIVIAYDPIKHKKPIFPVIDCPKSFKHITFDYVICNFVISAIPRINRIQLYEDLSCLNYQNLIIEARSIKDVAKIKHRRRYSDGYVTSRGTFQRGFEPADRGEMECWFGEHGRIFTKSYHALSFIWRNDEE